MTSLAQTLTTQSNRGEVAPANPVARMGATNVWDFMRINPPEYYISKIYEDPDSYIDEEYKVLAIMGVSSIEKAELTAYE